MKLFCVVPECPYPANTGGRIVMWKRIEFMSKSNDITLFSVIDCQNETRYKDKIEKYCKEVFFFSRCQNLATYFKSLLYPYPAVSRWNKSLKDFLSNKYSEINPDFVIVDFPQMIGVLPQNILESGKVVLSLHNIEYLSMRSLSNDIRNPLKRFIYKCVAEQMRRYEQNIYSKDIIALYAFVSSSDKSFFEKQYKKNNTLLVPVGAETAVYGRQSTASIGHNIIFVGKMSCPPNEEGALWLIDCVFPLIKEKIADAKLFIVGKDPSDKLLSNNCESVVVTGYVDSVRPYYEECQVAAVPVMTGGGVNVKLLESIGFGKIVVTTEKGINGTLFKKDEHVLVSNDPVVFAEYCINALLNPRDYDTMLSHATKTLLANYTWTGIVGNFEKKLMEMI